jgi:hypothetical protein
MTNQPNGKVADHNPSRARALELFVDEQRSMAEVATILLTSVEAAEAAVRAGMSQRFVDEESAAMANARQESYDEGYQEGLDDGREEADDDAVDARQTAINEVNARLKPEQRAAQVDKISFVTCIPRARVEEIISWDVASFVARSKASAVPTADERSKLARFFGMTEDMLTDFVKHFGWARLILDVKHLEVNYTAAEVRALRYVREQLTRRLKVYEDFPGALRDFMTRRDMPEEQAADFFAVSLADFRRLLSGKLSPVLGAPVIACLRRNL